MRQAPTGMSGVSLERYQFGDITGMSAKPK